MGTGDPDSSLAMMYTKRGMHNMFMKTKIVFTCIVLFTVCVLPCFGQARVGQAELRNAIRLEQEGRYDNALSEYERIVGTDADAEIKLEARVRAGRIYLDEKGDVARAVRFFEEGAKAVRFPELVAMSRVYYGRAILATARAEADYDRALTEFDSVIRTYGDSSAVVEALIFGGSVLELQHKFERAIINYQSVVFGSPDSPFAPLAFVRLGHTLARMGRTADALGAYQNVQSLYAGKPVAADAKKAATLLFRLFMLKERSPDIFAPVVIAEKSDSFKLDDPSRLDWLNSGDIRITDKERVFEVSAASGANAAGRATPAAAQVRPAAGSRGDCRDFQGREYRVAKKSITPPGSRGVSPHIRKPDGKMEVLDEVLACGVNRYGEIVISAKGPDGIYKMDPATGESTPFMPGQKHALKIAVDSESNFYFLNPEETAISIVDADGKAVTAISSPTVSIKELADFGLDAFDNIYLLDKQGKFVVLGGIGLAEHLKLKQIHKQDIVVAAKPAKDLRAITVAPAGTVYVVGKEQLFGFQ